MIELLIKIEQKGDTRCAIGCFVNQSGELNLNEQGIANALQTGLGVIMEEIAKINDESVFMNFEDPSKELEKRLRKTFSE